MSFSLCRRSEALHTHIGAYMQMHKQKSLSAENSIRTGDKQGGQKANEEGEDGGGWWIGGRK